MSDFNEPYFNDDKAARKHLELIRWPNGPICPHCGSVENIRKLKGKSTRPGVYKCNACKSPFSVTVGTVFERSHIKLHIWFRAVYLLCSSKKGMSSHQLHRMLGVTYKTAWFMSHRIREAMKDGTFSPMGGAGSVVEADETYQGNTENIISEGSVGPANKRPVVALVERGGSVRSFHVARADAETVREILVRNVDRKSELSTDESRLYHGVGREFAKHHRVHHSSGEYVRGKASTNTIEGFFSIFKRGMRGVYQHCAEKHLQRYLTEFDFRYNRRGVTDLVRAHEAMKGIDGKRLVYGGI